MGDETQMPNPAVPAPEGEEQGDGAASAPEGEDAAPAEAEQPAA